MEGSHHVLQSTKSSSHGWMVGIKMNLLFNFNVHHHHQNDQCIMRPTCSFTWIMRIQQQQETYLSKNNKQETDHQNRRKRSMSEWASKGLIVVAFGRLYLLVQLTKHSRVDAIPEAPRIDEIYQGRTLCVFNESIYIFKIINHVLK